MRERLGKSIHDLNSSHFLPKHGEDKHPEAPFPYKD